MDSELGIHRKLNRSYTYTWAVSVKRYRLFYLNADMKRENCLMFSSGKESSLWKISMEQMEK